MTVKFMETKSNEPRLTQKQISNHLGFSDSTIKRYGDDINMDSPSNSKKHRNKNKKSNTSITQTQNHTTNENTINNKNIEIKKRVI